MDNFEYETAKKHVKKIKGFYSHLIVFIAVNIMIIFLNLNNLDEGESYFRFKNFMTFTFWGIGLLAHGLSVFGSNLLFNSKWEEKKIKEFMEEEKQNKWE